MYTHIRMAAKRAAVATLEVKPKPATGAEISVGVLQESLQEGLVN